MSATSMFVLAGFFLFNALVLLRSGREATTPEHAGRFNRASVVNSLASLVMLCEAFAKSISTP